MKMSEHFKILAESPAYILGNEFEYGYLIDKKTKSNIYLGSSYGDFTFGIIDKNGQWALLLGNTSYLWTPTEIINLNEVQLTPGMIFEWPFTARQIADFEVEILDDPWSNNPGIFNLNVKSKSITRIRDFKKLEIPYNEKVEIKW